MYKHTNVHFIQQHHYVGRTHAHPNQVTKDRQYMIKLLQGLASNHSFADRAKVGWFARLILLMANTIVHQLYI